jgi:ATP-grasp domain
MSRETHMLDSDLVSENRAQAGPRVLVTDTNRWPSPARLAIGLSKLGCRVSGVCPTRGHPLLSTRVVRQTFPYSSLRPLESLAAAIEATSPDIIVPCDDRGVQHLHELFARAHTDGKSGAKLAALIERSLGAPANYPVVSSRYDLLRIAREEGVRVPDTAPVKRAEDLDSWQAGHPFPWVLKADGTFGGRGVKVAQNREQAERFFAEMSRPHRFARVFKRLIVNRDPFWLRPWWKRSRPAIVVQSHIQGHPANSAVFCWEGRVLAGVCVEVVSSDGSTGPAIIVRVVDNPAMMFAAERIARRLGLSGFFGLDFMVDEADGEAYLIEMNPRCTPLSHLQLGPGHDMIEALSAQLSGRPLRESPPVTHNDVIAYFPQAWTTKSPFLESGFLDIPQEEPELVKDLLRPWPERSLLYRLVSKVSATTTAVAGRKAARHGVSKI